MKNFGFYLLNNLYVICNKESKLINRYFLYIIKDFQKERYVTCIYLCEIHFYSIYPAI